MRIIAGKYKGRMLESPANGDIRPTSDFVREALFNVLQGRTQGAQFLDLFCGSGAVGLEALSRGAERSVFVDASRQSIALARSNAALLKAEAPAVFMNLSCKDALKKLGADKESFDIIYLDPPYDIAEREKIELIDQIFGLGILTPGGIAVFEMRRENTLSFSSKQYIIRDERCYGIKKLVFLCYAEVL